MIINMHISTILRIIKSYTVNVYYMLKLIQPLDQFVLIVAITLNVTCTLQGNVYNISTCTFIKTYSTTLCT